MIISRDIIVGLEPFISRNEFLAITGPRQTGKTTLLSIIKNYLKSNKDVPEECIGGVSFEDRILLGQFERDPAGFVNSMFPMRKINEELKYYLFIDEFQYAENGGQKLKLVYDSMPWIKIILTGSSSLELKASTGKFMTGRMLSFTLNGFSFGEYLRARNPRLEKIYYEKRHLIGSFISKGVVKLGKTEIDPFNEEMLKEYGGYCVWGGYPAVSLADNADERRRLLGGILNGYILKDIKGLLELAADRNLLLLARQLASVTGNVIVYHSLGQSASLDHRNLKRHLSILAETFIIKELRPFCRNKLKEVVKNPKIYFLDNGFRNYLIENMSAIDFRPDKGALVENAALLALYVLLDGSHTVQYWRTKAGAEVDFVLNMDGSPFPAEVKYSDFNKPEISRSYGSFINEFSPPSGMILTKNYWGVAKKNNTRILFAPVYYL